MRQVMLSAPFFVPRNQPQTNTIGYVAIVCSGLRLVIDIVIENQSNSMT